MKEEKVNALNHGVYRIFWKKKHGGGQSVGCVGSTSNGTRWLACANWTSSDNKSPMVATTDWSHVKHVVLIVEAYQQKNG